MAVQSASTATPVQVLQMCNGVILGQALYAAAKLGVADFLDSRPRAVSELAATLRANEPALLRLMRLLASQGVFEETMPGAF